MGIKDAHASWFLVITDAFKYCPNAPCKIHQNRSKFDESSAIVFYANDFDFKDLPPNRSENQYYVFLLHESPFHTRVDFWKSEGFYNLTMTYRLDSDLYAPYGCAEKIKPNDKWFNYSALEYFMQNTKNRSVAWMVSQCGNQNSHRKVRKIIIKSNINNAEIRIITGR